MMPAQSLSVDETVTITKRRYEQFKEDARVLSALRAAGVDNWEGYSAAYPDEDEY
jgi:hypothetical protein